jgi:hypothetical protein
MKTFNFTPSTEKTQHRDTRRSDNRSAVGNRIETWKPQSCGLTRREIRQVVIEQIG